MELLTVCALVCPSLFAKQLKLAGTCCHTANTKPPCCYALATIQLAAMSLLLISILAIIILLSENHSQPRSVYTQCGNLIIVAAATFDIGGGHLYYSVVVVLYPIIMEFRGTQSRSRSVHEAKLE